MTFFDPSLVARSLRVAAVCATSLAVAACSSSSASDTPDASSADEDAGPSDAAPPLHDASHDSSVDSSVDAGLDAHADSSAAPDALPEAAANGDGGCGVGTAVAATSIYAGANQVQSIAATATAVYWSENCVGCAMSSGSLWMKTLPSGTATQITFPAATNAFPTPPQHLVVDGTVLWFANVDGLWSVGLDGTNPHLVEPYSAIPGSIAGLAVDDASVYAIGTSSSFDTLVVQIPKAGGTVNTVATTPHTPLSGLSFAVDATNVYWSDYNDASPNAGGIFAAPKAGGGTAALLIQLTANDGDIDASKFAQGQGNALYVSTGTGIGIVDTTQPTAAPVTVTSDGKFPVIVDGTDAYYFTSSGSVWTLAHACGGPVATLPANASPSGLAIDATGVFVAGLVGNGNPTGGVWSATRP